MRRPKSIQENELKTMYRDTLDKKYLDPVVQVTRQYLLQRYLDTPSFGYTVHTPTHGTAIYDIFHSSHTQTSL